MYYFGQEVREAEMVRLECCETVLQVLEKNFEGEREVKEVLLRVSSQVS